VKIFRRAIAATDLLLIFPAVLFMTPLFSATYTGAIPTSAHCSADRELVHQGTGLARALGAADGVATGNAGHWRSNAAAAVGKAIGRVRQATARQMFGVARAHLATLLIAAATRAAGGILVIVALHAITD